MSFEVRSTMGIKNYLARLSKTIQKMEMKNFKRLCELYHVPYEMYKVIQDDCFSLKKFCTRDESIGDGSAGENGDMFRKNVEVSWLVQCLENLSTVISTAICRKMTNLTNFTVEEENESQLRASQNDESFMKNINIDILPPTILKPFQIIERSNIENSPQNPEEYTNNDNTTKESPKYYNPESLDYTVEVWELENVLYH